MNTTDKITWLQLSDLHIFPSAKNIVQENCGFNSLAESVHPNFIVISGDFRHLAYNRSFDDARSFINKMLEKFNLKPKDVYMVPGNHDVSIPTDEDLEKIDDILKEISKKSDIDRSSMPYLLNRFSDYSQFIESFYGNTVETNTRRSNPATVMLFPIENRFNLILLNTALASCDDKFGENKEIVDLFSLAKLCEKTNKLPSIIVAHHNPYNIHINQQTTLYNILKMLNVKAWLCGDAHITQALPSPTRPYFREPDIPILVCGKSVIQDGDSYSDNSVIFYELANNQIMVRVFDYSIGKSEAEGFHESYRFHDKADKPLTISLDICEKPDAIHNDVQGLSLSEGVKKEYKNVIRNELILPWIYDEKMSFDAIFPDLFIDPLMQGEKRLVKYSKIDSLKHSCLHSNIIITGDAGAGKSTLLKYLFLFKQSQDIEFLYVKAKSLLNIANSIESTEYLNYINAILDGARPEVNTIILLDGIDEAYPDGNDELDQLIIKCKNLKNAQIWFGWRKEHLNRTRTESLNQLIFDEICIQEWNTSRSRKYVDKYSKSCKRKDIKHIFVDSIKRDKQIRRFSQNPFKLSLLIYLIKNGSAFLKDTASFSLFTLYEKFIDLWIEKEDSMANKEEIIKELIAHAKQLYYHPSDSCSIDSNESVIRDLFHFQKATQAYEFCHQSLASFFIARNRIDKLILGGQNMAEELYIPMMADVTEFIKSAESYYHEQKKSIQSHLISLYDEIERNTTISEADLRRKNGIVYIITRLSLDIQTTQQFIRRIKDQEKDARMRVSIAFGAANIEMQDVTLEFAKEFYNDNSTIEKATRSFSLVYYHDVQQEDFFEYQDDGKVSWKMSREIRLENLKSKNIKEINFRILDIPVLYFFYKSRAWRDISLIDFAKIQAASINKHEYTTDAYEFLVEKLAELKKEYQKQLIKKYIHVNKLFFII